MLLFPSVSVLATEELENAIREGAVYSTRIEDRIFISEWDRKLIEILLPIIEKNGVITGNEVYESISIPLNYIDNNGVRILEISQDKEGIYLGYNLGHERYILMYFNDGVISKVITRYYDDENWIYNSNHNNEMYTWLDSKDMKLHEGLKENDPVIVKLENENRLVKYCLTISGGALVVSLGYILVRKWER